jgi:putative hemolysin
VARTAHVVPDTAEALEILSTLRSAEVPMALVHDEYGHFEGLVTPADLTGAIVGGFRSDEDPGEEQAAVQREDGYWLLAGWMPADKMVDMLRLAIPSDRSYQTVAGFLLRP